MNLRITFLSVILLALPALVSAAQTPAETAFRTAPRSVLPMLDTNTRLDMIDYYNSSDNKGAANSLGGRSRVTSMKPERIDISMTDATTYSICVIPSGSDSIIALITTVATPATDSKISFYRSDWTPITTSDIFVKPVFDDWLNANGKKNRDEVESTVPFMLTGFDYDPASLTLTITNNTGSFMPKEIYEMVAGDLYPSLTYKFNGKKFVKTTK
ncbi:MAG: DUF3256 family protein [Paramuribaculum sp.]|nr:DUF3256 family protein [Paramuribaculum sp.]